MSRVPLCDNLSGLNLQLRLGVTGSFSSMSFFFSLVVVCSSYFVFSLCMKFLIVSMCRACIGSCSGSGINF